MGPSLEHIPDDVLLEVVSHLPTIDDTLCSPLASFRHPKYAIPSTVLVRTPTLHALSKTSRLLRSRCLAIAWQRTEFWGINFWKRFVFDNPMGKATKNTLRVLKACPHLLPLIRTMSVILIEYQKAEIIPAFAACLATLPNLNTIRVIGSETRMQTVIKDAFRGKQFPSVRRISLPSSAHEIVRKCPNVEEVACVDEDGSKIVQSLVEGKCHQVRILKGISAPSRVCSLFISTWCSVTMTGSLTGLADLVPNLTHASVAKGSDMTPLTGFPFLDTIEILIDHYIKVDLPLSEFAALDIKKAREMLKGNKSQAEKTVVLTHTNNWGYRAYEFDIGRGYMAGDTIKV